jgi:8-oxo-dGTP diphosphatase
MKKKAVQTRQEFSPKSKGPARTDPDRSETEFLAKHDVAAFDRFSVAVDVVLVSAFQRRLHTVLLKRREHPHKDRWALPGGFMRKSESLDDAAMRVLRDKSGFAGVFVEQLCTFSQVDRDPRTRVISTAYLALVEAEQFQDTARANSDATMAAIDVTWPGEEGDPVTVHSQQGQALSLAFDHAAILGLAVKRLRGKLDYSNIAFALLGERFTLFDLQGVHEAVLGRALNKDSFRRRMLATGHLEPTGQIQSGVLHRPAELYRFRNAT